MGRRVLTVSELTFHQKRKPKERTYAPSDLNDEDLLDIFHDWVVRLAPADTHNKDRQTWVSVASATRCAPRVELVDLRVGAYGEAGELVDIDTGAPVGKIEDNQAPTGENRALLFVPETGESAFFLAEESTRGSAGGHILRLFRTHFSHYTSEITMVTSTVTEGEAWAEAAELTEVEVRVEGKSADLADGPRVQVGRVSHIARPEKKHRFPGGLLKSLKDEQTLRRIVSVPDLEEDHEVFVTLIRDGRTKKFQLGTEGAPSIREVLNDSTEETLDTATLVARCTDRVSDLCDRKGDTWDAAWSRQQRKE